MGVIVLAAGASRRLGRPKQALPYGDSTLLGHVVRQALAAGLGPVLVVVGAHAEEAQRGLPPEAHIVPNPGWEEGMASSLRVGLQALADGWPEAGAALVLACDQPAVSAALLRRMASLWRADGAPVVACAYGDTVGVPALFARELWPELMALSGDRGAKGVVLRHRQRARLVPFPEGALDVDTPQDWERVTARAPEGSAGDDA